MNGLLEKSKLKPIRITKFYAYWAVATLLMYFILRFVFPGPEKVGKLNFIGVAAGGVIGVLWSLINLTRVFLLAIKGIFVNTRSRNSPWRLIWITVEVAIPFIVGCCILLIIKANKPNLNLSDTIWSLSVSVFVAFFFISSIGYYLLELRFGRKFFNRPKK
jgi:hypothetical protein